MHPKTSFPVYELRIGANRDIVPGHSIRIAYALVKYESTWVMVHETVDGSTVYYLSRIMNQHVNVIDGYLYIDSEYPVDFLRVSRVLGTYYPEINPKNIFHESAQQQTIGRGKVSPSPGGHA